MERRKIEDGREVKVVRRRVFGGIMGGMGLDRLFQYKDSQRRRSRSVLNK